MKERLTYLFRIYLNDTCSDDERAELMELAKNIGNQAALNDLAGQYLEQVVSFERMDQERADEIFQSIIQEGKRRQPPVKSKTIRLWPWVAAASVIIIAGALVLAGIFTNNASSDKTAQNSISNDIKAPEINRATITLADQRTVYLDSAADGQLALQGNIKLVKLADGQIAYQTAAGKVIDKIEYNTVSNPRGSKVIALVLSDGSHVWLNSGSSITFPIAFIGNDRRIAVEGEAYFEVAPNALKPFIVSKGETSVEVLGTHFNLNAYSDEQDIKVTLLEGSVKVSLRQAQGDKTKIIKPGQQASIHQDIKVREVDVEEVMSWKEGIFLLDHTDLPALMRQISRWYNVDVVYEGKISGMRFGGGVSKDQPLSKILETLERYGLRFELDGKTLKVK